MSMIISTAVFASVWDVIMISANSNRAQNAVFLYMGASLKIIF